MMNNSGQQLSALDLISIVSFFVGLANYEENVDQTQLQDALSKAVNDIHAHLKKQDKKLDEILSMLNKKGFDKLDGHQTGH